jgi:hyaluronan synthase
MSGGNSGPGQWLLVMAASVLLGCSAIVGPTRQGQLLMIVAVAMLLGLTFEAWLTRSSQARAPQGLPKGARRPKTLMEYLAVELTERGPVHLSVFGLVFILAILAAYRVRAMSAASAFDALFFYSTLTFTTLMVKYVGSVFHATGRWSRYAPEEWPKADIVIPAYNEGRAIYDTIKSIARADYPAERLNVIVVDDGSSDDTGLHIANAARDFDGVNILQVKFAENRGKKEAMAFGIRHSSSDYLVFIDSDSAIDPQCLKEILRPFFKDPGIGAVSGHALVANADANLLAKMQEIRYLNAFRSAKALESLLGFVSCCPGCCSAYRREAIVPIMEPWLDQSFLGVKCTYGDDRSLTNMVLKSRWKTVYTEKAIVYTIVPDTLSKFNKQQIRWKKSWLRESVVVLSFVWRKNPLTAFLMIVDTITPFFAPVVILNVLVVYALTNHGALMTYVIGVVLFATSLGLFYRIHGGRRDRWWSGAMFSSLVALGTFWHLPYALATLRDSKWGTR